jgi:hypothetical protein
MRGSGATGLGGAERLDEGKRSDRSRGIGATGAGEKKFSS